MSYRSTVRLVYFIFCTFFFVTLVVSCERSPVNRIQDSSSFPSFPKLNFWEPTPLLKAINDLQSSHPCKVFLIDQENDTIDLSLMHDWNSYTMPLNLSLSCNGQTKNHSITIFQRKDIINQSPEIIDSIKIDLSCFTQGLLKVDNFFYFSCGQYDKSKLYALDIDNRRITKETKVDPSYFLEGIDLYDDSIIALTWKEHKMLFFSKDLVFSHAIDIPLSIKEGWGVFTVDGKIYISDGTSILHEFVVENSMLKQNRKLRIHQNGQELKFINEMAYVSDSTFAFNRWYDHRIYFANRHSGAVYKVLDFSKTAKNYRLRGVLNGVHIEKDMVYFTGKNWPWLFVGRFSYQ